MYTPVQRSSIANNGGIEKSPPSAASDIIYPKIKIYSKVQKSSFRWLSRLLESCSRFIQGPTTIRYAIVSRFLSHEKATSK